MTSSGGSSRRVHRLNEAPNVAVGECERLQGARVGLCQRYMIGHEHILIPDFLVHLDRFHKIDIAFVREDLHKVIAVPANVAKVYVEDLLALTEVADHVEDLHAWILKILGDSSLAEVQSMIGALTDRDELLQPIDGAKHAIHALIALGRNARILRMAGHANLVLVRHRNHTVEKVSDALPECTRIHMSSLGDRRLGMRIGQFPSRVHRIAAPWCLTDTKHTE